MSVEYVADDDAPPAKRVRLDNAVVPLKQRLAEANAKSSAEELVEISGYINPDLPAFANAIIKHRFTDFLVWEISPNGQVVRLKDISRPLPATKPDAVTNHLGKAADHANAQDTSLADLISEEQLQEVDAYAAAGSSKESITLEAISSKEKRKALHSAIREKYKGSLATEAKEGGAIEISWNTGRSKERRSVRPSKADQRDLPNYIQFTLQKTNRETQDCLSHLATKLGVNARDLGTAGTKDKRGVTTQLVTVKRGRRTIEEVWDQVNGLHHGRSKKAFRTVTGQSGEAGNGDQLMPIERGERGLRIGDLSYANKPLDLGMLSGNRFCIVLREVQSADQDSLRRSVQTLRQTGFINFYGMQRFGNSSVPTHLVGLALLRSDWAEAARLILSPRDGDVPDMLTARNAWTIDKDASTALRLLPRWATAERCILEAYAKDGTDLNHYAALSRIPKNLRMMYVHAYQSYIWNAVAALRVKQGGHVAPIEGDLVYSEHPLIEVQAEESANGSVYRNNKEAVLSTSKVAKVRRLAAEELPSYTIHDVVLPLPGYNVDYPAGIYGQLYRDMLHADGLDIDDLFRKQKEYSLGGAYRKVISKPADVTYEFKRYEGMDAQLTVPDEDMLLDLELPNDSNEGSRCALILSFNLDTAGYATMALREVLKSETGNVQQKALTDKAAGRDVQTQVAEA